MNILFTNFHPENGGGHRTYLNYLFNGISNTSNSNLNPYIAVPKCSRLNNEISEKFQFQVFSVDFPGKPKNFFKILKNVKIFARLIKQNEIDIVHANGNPDHKLVMICKWLYKFEFKIVRTKHDTSPIKKHFFSKILYGKYTDHLILVSNYQRENLLDAALLNKATVIQNGIDLNYYRPQKKSKRLFKKYNLKDNDIVFVSVAGTNLNKGWPLIVKAVSSLNPKLIDRIKIIVAGSIPENKIIDDLVKKFGLENQVIFPGFIDDVRKIISIADFGFVLSSKEALSYACREMMAMGVPVLVSGNNGLSENVINDRSGWVLQSNSVGEIELFIKSIDTINKQKFSESAFQKAQNDFGLERFLDKTINIYYNL